LNWLDKNPGRAKAINHGLAPAWLSPGRGFLGFVTGNPQVGISDTAPVTPDTAPAIHRFLCGVGVLSRCDDNPSRVSNLQVSVVWGFVALRVFVAVWQQPILNYFLFSTATHGDSQIKHVFIAFIVIILLILLH
jgi:hypothetical protein